MSPKTRIALGFSAAGLGSATTAAFGQAVVPDQASQGKDSETVVVTDRRINYDLLPNKILDTPQSIDVVPAEVIREQGVTSLVDALKNVPGITLNAGEGGTHGDLVNLRGFSAGDDYFLDGLRDTGLYNRDVFDADSIEVYKGPASTLFGRGTTGGVINQVSKAPQIYPIDDIALTGGTNAEVRATADVNYVLDDDAAIRLNLMGQRNNIVGRPFARTQKWGAAPAIALGLGTDTVYSLQYLHQQEDSIPDPGMPFLVGLPAPVSHQVYYGLPSDDRFKTDDEIVTGKITHKFDAVFSVSDTARYGSYWFDSRQTNPTYGSANCFTDAASPYYYSGATLCSSLPAAAQVAVTTFNPLFPVAGTPPSQIDILRDRPSSKGIIGTVMNSTDLTADFSFLFLTHHLTVGGQVDIEDASLTRYANQNTAILPTTLLAPDPYESFPGTQTSVSSQPLTKTSTLSGYAVDTIEIDPQWSVIGGVRYDNFGARYDQPLGKASHFTHKDNIASPRAALVYKPTQESSIYFSYGTSYNPSAETLSLAASNQGLSPERDLTYEAGGKINVLDGGLALTAAIFNTVKTNARISDPLNPSLQSLAGTERINGVEFGAQGHLTENWELTAGYTYLAPRAVGLVAVGVPGPIPNVARNQANIWSVYDFESGLKTGLGLNWTGRRDAASDTLSIPGTEITAKLPSTVTVDAMLTYPVNDNLSLQLNGYNLANTFYYATSYFTRPGENHAQPGAGRTFLLTAGNRALILHIPAVLGDEALAGMRARLAAASWGEGRVTAGPQSGAVKRNLQLPEDSVEARALGDMVLAALDRSSLFLSAALPSKIYPPLFNKYGPGMDFGAHIDNAIRRVTGTRHRIRTDLSATLFLSDRDSYAGGELVIEDDQAIKLEAGDMILYPANSLHRVMPVTRGERFAVFFWVQSLIADAGERALLFQLDRSVQALSASLGANHDEVLRLTGLYHNLVRKWSVP